MRGRSRVRAKVATVQFFANSISLGVVSNSSQVVVSNISPEPLFPLAWPNPPAGSLCLEGGGNRYQRQYGNVVGGQHQCRHQSAAAANIPFAVSFCYPTNGEAFAAPLMSAFMLS